MDMALDDLIVTKRIGRGGEGGGRGRGRGGFARRGGMRGGGGASPRAFQTRSGGIPNGMWTRGGAGNSFGGRLGFGGGGGGNAGVTKIQISNLDFGVSDDDVKELFSEFGAMRRSRVHYDHSGRSLGTAEVMYERRGDALQAIKAYNGMPLDGRPMRIEIVTAATSMGGRVARAQTNGFDDAGTDDGLGRVATRSAGGGRGRGARGRGRGARGGAESTVTVADLDKELEAYSKKK